MRLHESVVHDRDAVREMKMMILITLLLIITISWTSIDGFYLSTRQQPSSHRPFRRKQIHPAQSKQGVAQQTDNAQQQTTASAKPWIVVVEDEDYLRNAIGKYVSKEGGYHVTGVADARSAFLLCRGIFKPTSNRYTSFKFDPNYNETDYSVERPNCIVLDVRLGGEMDGIELLNIIRSDPLLESLPVILLTARGKVDDRIAGYEAGADAYLTKPFDPEELLSVLEGVLRRDAFVSSGLDAAAVGKNKRESTSNSEDSILPMEEIKREIEEIKSLLRQRNDSADSKISNSSTPMLVESDATPSFASMYNDLLEIKKEIKATSNANVLQPVDANAADVQTAIPRVTMDDINELYFTPDERKVISLVEKGFTNKEIGEEYLKCSISKVEKIVSSLFKKTRTKKRPQLVEWCKQNHVHDSEGDQGEVIIDAFDDNISNASKENEIMDLIGKGFTNKEIVTNLGVSLKDIVTVVDAMQEKAKVSNRTELMRWWNSKENKNE